jgi:phosphoribosylformylglycinamidine synthase
MDRVPDYKAPPKGLDGKAIERAALELLARPNIASKRWVFEQYDSQVMTQTLEGPGGSAAVLRLKGSGKRIAISTDCNSLFCYLDPREGAKLAVAEAARNVVCAGATPLAITNCLNFGNPNKPGVMFQFAETIAGMSEACRAFGTPVTGGNVSFYNESPSGAVFPTPVIGMIGNFSAGARLLRPRFARKGLDLWSIGPDPTTLGGSQFAQMGGETPIGPCPRIDLEVELNVQRFILEMNEGGLIEAAQDVGEGGLFVAAAECAMAGGVGCELLAAPDGIGDATWLFGEDPSRVLVATTPERGESVYAEARARGTGARRIGRTGGGAIGMEGVFSIELDSAVAVYDAAR